MQESVAIEFKDVVKRFGEQVVLNHLNFSVPKGSIVTILGFSGAGKSTLLKHVLGLMQPSSGEIEVLGQELAHLDQVALREFRKKFGMLFQYAALFDSKTAMENAAFPLVEFTNLSKKEIEERAIQLLISVGLDEHAFHKFPSELSGGMRKRVGLARALALEPDIMLYDEPTTGLDPITTKMVNDLIKDTSQKQKERQMTSLIISHDVKASLRISDFVAFLDHGTIIEYSPVEEFKSSQSPLVRQFLDL